MTGKVVSFALVLLLVSPITLEANLPVLKTSIEKAFDAIQNKEFAAAQNFIEKSEHVFPALAAYCDARLHAVDSLSCYSLDSSYLMIQKAIALWPSISKRENKIATRLDVNPSKLTAFMDSVVNRAFSLALQVGTTSALDSFISGFPVKGLLDSAIAIRNRMAFELTEREGTASGYLGYMNRYPDSPYFITAKNRYAKLLYEESVRGGKAAEYEVFIRSFPNSPYVLDAWRKLFSLVTKNSSDEGPYIDFVSKYPSSPLVEEACYRIRESYLRKSPDKGVDGFANLYPYCALSLNDDPELLLVGSWLLPFASDSLWGFMDTSGSVVLKPVFDDASCFYAGLSKVISNSKTGFINARGDDVVKPYYDFAKDFDRGFAVVSESGLYGLIDRRGNTVVPVSYDSVSISGENTFVGFQSGSCRYLNRLGEPICDSTFLSCGAMEQGFAIVSTSSGFGVIKADGILIFNSVYSNIKRLSSSLFAILGDGGYALADTGGTFLTRFVFDDIGEFSQGMAAASINGRFGYIDQRGRTRIPFIFQTLKGFPGFAKFNNGYAVISLTGTFGIADTAGNVLIGDSFDKVDLFENGIAIVYEEGKGGILEIGEDRFLTDSEFDSTGYFSFGFLPVRIGDKWGAVDSSGKFILQTQFLSLTPLPNGYFAVASENGYGIVDVNATQIVDAKYDNFELFGGRFVRLDFAGKPEWFDTATGNLITAQKK
ncbi:MAG: WG repeat-containing protein [Arcticibacter sp.]